MNKVYKYLNVIIVLILLNGFNMVQCKPLIALKHYANKDCTGPIILYQVLLTVKDYLFQLPTIGEYYTLNCTGNFAESDAPCYLEGYGNCIENPTNCREYIYYNECNSGRELVYETLDYMENDYCTCTETSRAHNFIDEEIAWEGVQIIKRNFCHRGLTLDCNYFIFILTQCDTGEVVFKSRAQKFIESSNLTKLNAAPNETLMITYRPNDPDYYKNTLMAHRIPHDKQLYLDMLTDDQISYIRNPSAVL